MHAIIELLYTVFVCIGVCVCVGVDISEECQLERLEGWSVCCTADGENGEHSTGHVQETPFERTAGQFCHTDFI